MKNKLMFTLFAGLVTMSLGATAARADSVTITLNSPTMTATPGSTIDFFGTVTAPSGTNTGTVYLNRDNANFYGDGTVDSANGGDDPFLDAFVSVSAGGSQTGELFTVTLDPNATAGLTAGIFQVYGGTTSSSADLLGTVNFDVNVAPAATVTPEPSTWLLLATGAAGVLALYRQRRQPVLA